MITDKLDDKIKITTGDGKNYELPYKLSERRLEFNTEEYNFLNTEGTFVNREMPKSSRYDLTVYFTGDNHLEDANKFEQSAKDRRYWVVKHPYNGTRNMQPFNLTIDTTNIAYTLINISLAETLTEEGVLIEQDFKSNVQTSFDTLQDSATKASAEKIGQSTSEFKSITDASRNINNDLKTKINFQDVSFDYNKLVNSLAHYTDDPLEVMNNISQMLLLPVRFVDSIKDRMKFIESQFSRFYALVSNIGNIYSAQFLGASVVSSMCVASLPDDQDQISYNDTHEISNSIEEITAIYNAYNDNLQLMQSVDGFVPDYEIYVNLYHLVVYTLNHLYEIAIDVPFIITTTAEKDTNAILLAHKYGMTVEELFKVNNWSVAQTLIIEKDTKVKYYV